MVLIGCLLLAGCSGGGPDHQATYPVTGEIYVDGEPTEGIAVQLNRVGSSSGEAALSSTFSGEDGKFAVSTFEEGDGAPAGEYKVTFTWGELNLMSMQYEGDKLNGRYADVESSEYTINVGEGGTDMGRIELTTN